MTEDSPDPMSTKSRGIAVGVASLLFLVCLYPAVKVKKSTEAFDLTAFGQIPIFYQGRPQPIDSLARNSLLFLNDRETYSEKAPDSDKKVTKPAVQWMLDVITDHPQPASMRSTRLKTWNCRRPWSRTGGAVPIPYADFEKKLLSMEEELNKLGDAKTESLNLYQRKLVSLARRVQSVRKLEFMFLDLTETVPPFPTAEAFKENPETAQEQLAVLRAFLQKVKELTSGSEMAIAVPMHIGVKQDPDPEAQKFEWMTLPEAMTMATLSTQLGREPPPAAKLWHQILSSYKANKPTEFNQHVADYLKLLNEATEKERTAATGAVLDTKKTAFEYAFNRIGPFNLASYLYLVAFVFVALGWVSSDFGWMKPLHTVAFTFALLTFGLHAVSIVGRIYISGRPPVTNLYSAAVFIGCAASLFALVCELFIKRGIGTTLVCVSGYLSLKVAYALTTDGDTFAVLQAVLDTQFWLATHVVTITLGYATTYVSGLIAIAYIVGGVCTPALTEKDRDRLVSMMYGTQCFAIFFSFVGTVLGGLWADDSWGRFWGWGPQGEWSPDHRAVECPGPACPLGRDGPRPRHGGLVRAGEHRRQLVVLRRERTRRRSACLRADRRAYQMARAVCCQPAADHGPGPAPQEHMVELQSQPRWDGGPQAAIDRADGLVVATFVRTWLRGRSDGIGDCFRPLSSLRSKFADRTIRPWPMNRTAPLPDLPPSSRLRSIRC